MGYLYTRKLSIKLNTLKIKTITKGTCTVVNYSANAQFSLIYLLFVSGETSTILLDAKKYNLNLLCNQREHQKLILSRAIPT